MCRFLLEHGADVTATTTKGQTPADLASTYAVRTALREAMHAKSQPGPSSSNGAGQQDGESMQQQGHPDEENKQEEASAQHDEEAKREVGADSNEVHKSSPAKRPQSSATEPDSVDTNKRPKRVSARKTNAQDA